MSSEIQHVLQNLAFTRDLDPAHLERLAALATPVQWEVNQTIFREGDEDTFLYLVVEGRVAIDVSVPRRGRIRILTVDPGNVFGWSSVYYQQPKTAGATAIEPTKALALDAARLRELSEADCSFGYWLARRLLHVVSDRLKETRVQALDVYGS